MYSRNMSNVNTGSGAISLPSRYSGVRFRRDKRSDGRDVVIEAPMREPERTTGGATQDAAPPREPEQSSVIKKISQLFSGIGQDDVLIAALIMILAGEGKEENREAVMLLILLLCVR